MIEKLGIIPAAGKAQRFGGVLKEMLPVSDGATLIKRTLTALNNGGCDMSLLITSREKMQAHAQHLEDWPVYYVIQSGHKDIWSAIIESLPIHGKVNLFAMPDTFFPMDIFKDFMQGDFVMGAFETTMPERFGVLTENGIVNKRQLPPGTYRAWGVIGWTDKVAQYWIEHVDQIETYTQALNMAMAEFGYHVKPMAYYYDLAAWADYQKFVRGEK